MKSEKIEITFSDKKLGQGQGTLGLSAKFGRDNLVWNHSLDAKSASQSRANNIFAVMMNIVLLILSLWFMGFYIYRNFDILSPLVLEKFTLSAWESFLQTDFTIFGVGLLLLLIFLYRLLKNKTLRKTIASSYSGKDENKFGGREIDISEFFTKKALASLDMAYMLAVESGYKKVWPVHLAKALVANEKVKVILARAGVSYKAAATLLNLIIDSSTDKVKVNPSVSEDFKKILFLAYVEAYQKKRDQVGTPELLLALSEIDSSVAKAFYEMELDQEKLRNVVTWVHLQKELVVKWKKSGRLSGMKSRKPMNRALTARPTPFLDSVSEDLTFMAREGALAPLVNWEEKLNRLFDLLEKGNGNVVLVGEEGVGKTDIVKGLAQLMAAEDVPQFLEDKRLLKLSVESLVAGASEVGDIEARVQNLAAEMIMAGNIVLFVPDIAHLAGTKTATTGNLDALNILGKALGTQNVHVIGTSTLSDYQKHLQNHPAFLRYFKKEEVAEVGTNTAIQIVGGKALLIEAEYRVVITYPAIAAAVKMSGQYIHDVRLPRKAVEVLAEAANEVLRSRGERQAVVAEDIAQVITGKTKVKVTRVTQDEKDFLLNLEEELHKSVIGQDEAVNSVASAIRRSRAQLRSEKKPIVNLLFVGPTGVGKTELAKTTARVYFGQETEMIRLDMSEYQTPDDLKKMIGSPGTADGEATTGYLTKKVKHNPFSIVLLDELEKAHPSVVNIFLQVMDDGRLTDARGETIDFTNTIIVATSNAGTAKIQEAVKRGEDMSHIKNVLLEDTLKQTFRPELLNRFDGIILFSPLSQENLRKIAQLMLAEESEKLEQKHGATLETTPAAIDQLVEKGYDPAMGARPLRRVIQEDVQNALAKLLLEGNVRRGQTVVLDVNGKVEVK